MNFLDSLDELERETVIVLNKFAENYWGKKGNIDYEFYDGKLTAIKEIRQRYLSYINSGNNNLFAEVLGIDSTISRSRKSGQNTKGR